MGSVVLLLGDTSSQNQVPVPKEKNFRWKDGIYERGDRMISFKKPKTCLQGLLQITKNQLLSFDIVSRSSLGETMIMDNRGMAPLP